MNEIGLYEEDRDEHFILMADIDLDPNVCGIDRFFAIGRNPRFSGVHNGNNHTVFNLTRGEAEHGVGGSR